MPTNTKHTPGPWEVRHVDTKWVTVARVGYAPTVCHLGDAEEVDANALLIAAAPDLLAALVAIEALTYEAQGEMQDGQTKRDVVAALNAASAALQKAGVRS